MSDDRPHHQRRIALLLQKVIIVLGAIAVLAMTAWLVITPREGRAWRRATSTAIAGSVCLALAGAVLIATRRHRD